MCKGGNKAKGIGTQKPSDTNANQRQSRAGTLSQKTTMEKGVKGLWRFRGLDSVCSALGQKAQGANANARTQPAPTRSRATVGFRRLQCASGEASPTLRSKQNLVGIKTLGPYHQRMLECFQTVYLFFLDSSLLMWTCIPMISPTSPNFRPISDPAHPQLRTPTIRQPHCT